MHQRQFAGFAMQGAQQRQGNAMFAAERNQVGKPGGLLFDQCQAAAYVAQSDVEIADIGQWQLGRIHPRGGVRAIHQHAAGMANGMRTEAAAGAIGGADIERNAGDDDRRRPIVPRCAEKARWRREGGKIGHAQCPIDALDEKYAARST